MQPGWTIKKIKIGFEKFISANGHLPKAREIDELGYLPSSRYIQKRFGGLEFLRNELGYTDSHFGKGAHRSDIARITGEKGRQLELDFGIELQQLFNANCIDVEKSFDGKKRVDFYIHTPTGNFGIDIFNAETIQTMQSSINIKLKKYSQFTEPLYITVINADIKQRDINEYVARRKNPLPANINLATLPALRKFLQSKQNLKFILQ